VLLGSSDTILSTLGIFARQPSATRPTRRADSGRNAASSIALAQACHNHASRGLLAGS
jgi:hypothetical protein